MQKSGVTRCNYFRVPETNHIIYIESAYCHNARSMLTTCQTKFLTKRYETWSYCNGNKYKDSNSYMKYLSNSEFHDVWCQLHALLEHLTKIQRWSHINLAHKTANVLKCSLQHLKSQTLREVSFSNTTMKSLPSTSFFQDHWNPNRQLMG
jgi:hypothetical protein